MVGVAINDKCVWKEGFSFLREKGIFVRSESLCLVVFFAVRAKNLCIRCSIRLKGTCNKINKLVVWRQNILDQIVFQKASISLRSE